MNNWEITEAYIGPGRPRVLPSPLRDPQARGEDKRQARNGNRSNRKLTHHSGGRAGEMRSCFETQRTKQLGLKKRRGMLFTRRQAGCSPCTVKSTWKGDGGKQGKSPETGDSVLSVKVFPAPGNWSDKERYLSWGAAKRCVQLRRLIQRGLTIFNTQGRLAVQP